MKVEKSVNPTEEIEKLIRNISILSWLMTSIYSAIDYFNKSYVSSLFLGIGGALLFPLIIWLNKRGRRNEARVLLVILVNAIVFVAVVTTPFDDGGRFYFVPVSLMALLIYELYEFKSLLFGLLSPILTYIISMHVTFPGYIVTAESGMAPDHAKIVNFLGVYVFTLSELYFFVNYVRRMRVQAIEQSKFSALGIMSSGIAHEINNPLAIIKGRAFMLRKHLANDEKKEIEKDVEVILKTSDRIGKIIQGLRIFSRNADSDPFNTLGSDELIQTALDLCSERFQLSNINVQVLDKGHFKLQGKEAQLIQVLVNLLNNSFDAIQDLKEKWIRIEVDADTIRVIDSGQGIPKDIAEKLMLPFYTTKGIGKGTGLGLSISKGIIEKHDGELFLDSSHANTCFVMRFNAK